MKAGSTVRACAVAVLGLAIACNFGVPTSGKPVELLESPTPTSRIDKWALWTNGTQLRGANVWQRLVVPDLDGLEFLGGGPIGPPYTQQDFDRLASLGANYVNLSLPGLFTERAPYGLDEGVQTNLDRLLEMAARADLFAVITFRTGPGRSDFTFYRDGAGDWFPEDLPIESVWSDSSAQEAWVRMWRYTAERYRDNPNVVGYDLMCEPNSDDVVLGLYDPEAFYPTHAGSLLDWNHFYPRIVAGIREVDGETPILVSAMGWGAVRWLPYLQAIDDPHIVYTVHQYEPQTQYTHQPFPARNGYPGRIDFDEDGGTEPFDSNWLNDFLATLGEYMNQHGAPVAVNEFGVMRWVPGAERFISDEMALFERLGLNNALWVWDPAWEPWVGQVNDFTFRFGPDPANHAEQTADELTDVIARYWRRNSVRPSNVAPSSETFPPSPSQD